jgi:hypothetical protein
LRPTTPKTARRWRNFIMSGTLQKSW